jgi:integrase
MSKPNVHGLPQHLRKDAEGYFLDYFVQEGGLKKRKRVRLGFVPLAKAKIILAQNMTAMLEQRFLAADRKKVTFNEVADSFLAYSKVRKKSHRNDIPIVTRLKAFLGNRSLESLNPELLETYLLQRQKEGQLNHKGKSLSGTTLNKEIACLRTIIRRAIRNGQLDRDPIMEIKRFKEIPRDRTLSPEEYQRFLKECSRNLRPIVQLAYSTGMRCGEILGLRWEQVDFKNKVIILEALDTKTQEKREIPLSLALVGLLQQVPRTLGCPYVFTYRGKRMESVKTAFKGACRKAGVLGFRFHDLRHCAVTNFRKAGVSDSVIMSISGHKTHSVFRRYDRIDREDRHNALGRVESLIDTGMTLAETRVPLEESK